MVEFNYLSYKRLANRKTMIIKLTPSVKSYIWGGTNLKRYWNKISNDSTVAETWELSLNSSGMCCVCGGPFDGKSLAEVIKASDIGDNSKDFPFFPVLIKLIDAATPLSLQVHPTDDYALQHEGKFGKTEMWHIVDAADNAYIYLGFNRDVTKEQFIDALNNKTLTNLLNKVSVKPNQTYFVPSGTIHAIGSGVTLIEIQQNSDLTYRVYDYDRLGLDGKPRELHVNKALDVLNFDKYDVPDPNRYELLGKCKYFSAYRYNGDKSLHYADSFASVTSLEGDMQINDVALKKGETVFVSAGTEININADGSYCVVTVEK